MRNNPYQAYKQQSIMTMTPADMLTALYDGLLKQFTLAIKAIEEKDYSGANTSLQKGQKILRHLQTTLDDSIDISKDLNSLYDFFIYVSIQCNMKKEIGELPTVITMIEELRNTYIQADKKLRSGEKVG